MTTLNKNYTTISGASDKVSDIDARHNAAMTEIEADMTTIESHLNNTSNPHSVDATDVGLGSCDNTADIDKPISTATQTALDAKMDIDGELGDITVDSLNKITVTAPASGSTLTIVDGKTLTVSDDATVSGTNTGDQTDATLTFTDVTTNNSSTSKHGFLKKLSNNSLQFMDGAGNWSVPGGGTGDTLSPATNTDSKLPQWDGNDSKTLKDGLSFLDEDSMVSDSATAVPSQQSVKAYADTGLATKLATPAAWTSFTPTFTNLTVGNGTLSCAYCQAGKLVFFRVKLTFGTTSSIAGSVACSLPITSVSYPGTASVSKIGEVSILDAGTAVFFGPFVWATTTTGTVQVHGTASTYLGVLALSSSVPMTWTTSDELHITGSYEAA